MSDPYRQYIPDLQLSIERNTESVPADDCYYVIRDGTTFGRFRSLKKAQELFREIVQECGYKPQKEQPKAKTPSGLSIEQYVEAKDLYWAESYKFKGKRGKGGRGGV